MSLSLSGEEDEDQRADTEVAGAHAQQWNVTRFFSLSTPDWTEQRKVDKLTTGYCAPGFIDDCSKPLDYIKDVQKQVKVYAHIQKPFFSAEWFGLFFSFMKEL